MGMIRIEPLTKAAFAPFGEVVESEGATPIVINEGFAARLNSVARIDVSAEDGHVNIAIFEAKPRPQPISITMMERHPLGSQLFMPLQPRDWLVVVCTDPAAPESFRAFAASGRQGVNYARGTWHFPLLVSAPGERFLVVDRAGQGQNLEEVTLPKPLSLPVFPASDRSSA